MPPAPSVEGECREQGWAQLILTQVGSGEHKPQRSLGAAQQLQSEIPELQGGHRFLGFAQGVFPGIHGATAPSLSPARSPGIPRGGAGKEPAANAHPHLAVAVALSLHGLGRGLKSQPVLH